MEEKKKKTVISIAQSNLDLETLSTLPRIARINRLIFIAERCPSLAVLSLSNALQELQATAMVEKYSQVANKLNQVLKLQGSCIELDHDWMNATAKANQARHQALDAELKHNKANSNKESVRLCTHELGKFCVEIGDLEAAQKYFQKTRDYLALPEHSITMCLAVIETSIHSGNTAHVLSYIAKANSTPGLPAHLAIQLTCYSGMMELENCHYQKVARLFTSLGFSPTPLVSDLNPNDVALIGGLCALATFDRKEIKSKIFENTAFKQYLELEPVMKSLIGAFYETKYTTALDIFASLKNDLFLNPFLVDHVEILYQLILKRALVQYFTPFLSVDMNKMAAAFNTSLEVLERLVVDLIGSDQIQGRIDSHNKTLVASDTNQRHLVFEKSIEMARQVHLSMRLALMRTELVRLNLSVDKDEPLLSQPHSNSRRHDRQGHDRQPRGFNFGFSS